MRHHRYVSAVAATQTVVLLLAACRVTKVERRDEHPPALADRWVRVYPPGRQDTLALRRDGTVGSAPSAIWETTSPNLTLTHWRVGHRLMPGGFCIGSEKVQPDGTKRYSCMGYRLRGDTFALADQEHNTFVRASVLARLTAATSRPADAAAPVEAPAAPKPGDSVRVLAPTK